MGAFIKVSDNCYVNMALVVRVEVDSVHVTLYYSSGKDFQGRNAEVFRRPGADAILRWLEQRHP